MNTSGEAADQVVRMSLEVGEAALKITGAGAKQLAVLLILSRLVDTFFSRISLDYAATSKVP